MKNIYKKSSIISENAFCPGCLHGVASKLIAEVLEELQIHQKAICVLPVGCGTLNMESLKLDRVVAAHGRAPAVATGLKRSLPDNIVFTYQGDGDLASIGLAEIIHAANRGENITVIFVNNSIYGMTGGQLAPTTLVQQQSTTSKFGRNTSTMGYPIKMAEIITQLESPTLVARQSLDSPRNIIAAKKIIRRAFENQMNHKGFSFVELLSNCPTNWKMKPIDSLDWMRSNVIPYFELGILKDVEGGK
ncbi:MAG: thiamine pyrophosphate-dependent enzyme [Eubacteriales bacterium]|nr:thiamine pyrophosphate-dependent enzyme [Eubacteriales bacterium]